MGVLVRTRRAAAHSGQRGRIVTWPVLGKALCGLRERRQQIACERAAHADRKAVEKVTPLNISRYTEFAVTLRPVIALRHVLYRDLGDALGLAVGDGLGLALALGAGVGLGPALGDGVGLGPELGSGDGLDDPVGDGLAGDGLLGDGLPGGVGLVPGLGTRPLGTALGNVTDPLGDGDGDGDGTKHGGCSTLTLMLYF